MRELIYLSDGKLQQFLPEPVPRWRSLGRLRAQLQTPVGSISVERASSDEAAAHRTHLEQVINHIELGAKWYETEDLQAGEWIFFEAWLIYRIYRPANMPAVVLLLNKLQARQPRLLLHGSARHLVGTSPARDVTLASHPRAMSGPDIFASLSTILPELIKPLDLNVDAEKAEDPGYADPSTNEIRERALGVEDYHAEAAVWGIIEDFDCSTLAGAYAWMAGYARVTAKFDISDWTRRPAIVVASPLYVELRPSQTD